MKQLDEILYDALRADADLMQAVGERIVSTCFEVGPDCSDNTELPNIIVTDDGWQNQPETKDTTWEGTNDRILASIDVGGRSPKDVKQIIRMCRKAVAAEIHRMTEAGEEIPYLDSVQASQLEWDWIKPCYHQSLTYQVTIYNEE